MTDRLWRLYDGTADFDVGDEVAERAVWRERPALRLSGGAPVSVREPLPWDAFDVEAEVACPGPEGFVGLLFGGRNLRNFELVYLSPGRDGRPGEVQYDPVMNGSNTWQIYHGPRYQAWAPFAAGEWTRLRLEVRPWGVAVCVGGGAPHLVVRPLQGGTSRGAVGVWGHLPSYVRDLSVTVRPDAKAAACRWPAAANVADPRFALPPAGARAARFAVSAPHSPNRGGVPRPQRSWRTLAVEDNGILNCNRLYPSAGGAAVHFCTTLWAAQPVDATLSLGFSDRLRLWAGPEEVYAGECCFGPPAADGRIVPTFMHVPVRLPAGPTVLSGDLAATEGPFGWGLYMAAAPADRLRYAAADRSPLRFGDAPQSPA